MATGKWLRAGLSSLTLAALAQVAHAAPAPLTLCFEDVAQRPWSMPDATGLNFELLKRVQQALGEQFRYAPKPWRRCMEELRLGAVDGVIAAADASARRSFAIVPTLPDGGADPGRALYVDNVNVFLRVGGQASWNGHQLSAPRGEVAVQAGYLIGNNLRAQGLLPRELVKSADDGLRLLVSGLFDVAVLQGTEASLLVQSDPRFRDRVQQASPRYAALDFHLMFNRRTYDRDPRRIEAIWHAIGLQRQSADYRQLAATAGVAPP
ncbi:transporter substrate-binding domain-containing protein [Rugamonas apoptosis]|uniref:Transporter substrate-binding domain-containing protein n=1 Tax=Rugamonas apoptosis TaxID=2758570 RepID=A0A7W2FET9_9BURK|nr:transporter substrate-binding domain-containing protein [Rugamonas apoptosis]MBA5690416.1 transporter substrate-binding domain-containing protein [Rugamonas apoptosis]